MKMRMLFLVIGTLVWACHSEAQDYIVTWKNDTIVCQLPGDAKKAGFKPVWKYEDGYERIVAFFNGDSVRVISAGEIKGYSRQKHGKRLLCDGFFEAKQIIFLGTKKRTLVDETKNTEKSKPWVFMNRLIDGKYANLYIVYQLTGDGYEASYYLSRHGVEASNTVMPFFNKKKMIELMSDSDIASEMKAFRYKKSNKGFAEIVNEYNRLKEAAAKKVYP